jgi:uncharacterized protein
MSSSGAPDYTLIDRAGAGSWLFYPRRDASPPPQGASDIFIDIEGGVTIGARFYPVDPDAPTILYFHGNGEIASDHDGIAPMYHEIRVNLFVADFRGYGSSGGRPTFASLVADAHPVAAAFHSVLDERGYSGSRFIMGRSLGSHPALEIAARIPDHFRGLIIESGAANLRRLISRVGFDAESGEGAALADAHAAKVRSVRLPSLIIHGEYDELIPLQHAAELYEMLEDVDRELHVIPGAGHNDLLWLGQDQYFEAISAFVARLA